MRACRSPIDRVNQVVKSVCISKENETENDDPVSQVPVVSLTLDFNSKMTSVPDYTAQGYKEIIVTLEGSILTILINRAK